MALWHVKYNEIKEYLISRSIFLEHLLVHFSLKIDFTHLNTYVAFKAKIPVNNIVN